MLMVIAIFALFVTVFLIGKMSLLYCQPIFLTSIRMICADFLSWPEISLIIAATSTVIGWSVLHRVIQTWYVDTLCKWMEYAYWRNRGLDDFVRNGSMGSCTIFVDYKIFLGYMISLMMISNIFCYNSAWVCIHEG